MKKISQKTEVRLLSAIMIITLFLPNFIIPSAAWSGTPLCNQATVYLNSQEVIRPNESYKAISEKFLPSSILCGDMLYLPLELLIECGMDLDVSNDSITINSMKSETYISMSAHKKDETTVRLGSKGTAYLDNVIDIVVAGKKIAKANQSITYNGQTYPSSFWPKEAIYLPVEPILKELGTPVRWDKNTSSLYIGSENNSQSNSMSVSANIISVKKQTNVYLTMADASDDVIVTYNILNDGLKYVSAEWGDWEGDRIPLNLTPLRSGTAIIRLTNSLNSDFVDITAIVEIAEQDKQTNIQKVSSNSLTIKQKTSIDVTMPIPDVTVTYNILDSGSQFISVEWGEFVDGVSPLYITPLKNGTAKIKITNDYNSDTEYITVTVNMGGGASLSNFAKNRSYTSGQFTDVPSSAWYADRVKAAYEYGLMSGTGNSLFQPSRNITIAEAIVIASQLHNTYYSNGNTFQGNEIWYQPYVDYALSNRIITQSYSNYNTPISRSEFAIIMSNAFPDAALAQINTVQDNAIPDVAAGSNYYNAVYRLYRAGVISGVGSTRKYNPDAQITRAEVATILGNMVDTNLRSRFTLNVLTTPTQPQPDRLNPAISVSINKTGLSNTIGVGEYLIIPIITDPIGTVMDGRAQWISSNPDVASVNEVAPLVYGISEGTTVITAYFPNGQSDSWAITVKKSDETFTQPVTPTQPTIPTLSSDAIRAQRAYEKLKSVVKFPGSLRIYNIVAYDLNDSQSIEIEYSAMNNLGQNVWGFYTVIFRPNGNILIGKDDNYSSYRRADFLGSNVRVVDMSLIQQY